MLIGQAWLAPGAAVTPDAEHDAHAWWPADPAAWPGEAHASLRAMAAMLEDGRMTFEQLKYLSFAHSAIYLTLLIVWLVPRLEGADDRSSAGRTASAGSSCRCSASTPSGAA